MKDAGSLRVSTPFVETKQSIIGNTQQMRDGPALWVPLVSGISRFPGFRQFAGFEVRNQKAGLRQKTPRNDQLNVDEKDKKR